MKYNNVFLTSYMRPEMTRASIESVLQWDNLGKLTIVIDGLRSFANDSEINWRNQTIKLAEDFCSRNSKMDLWVYTDNIGITNHTMRIQGRALEAGNSGIWLEEDIDLDLRKYSSILNQLDLQSSSEPMLISAFSHFNHPQETDRLVKGNLFLPIWGMAFNESFYELVCKVWSDKEFNKEVVTGFLGQFFRGRTLLDQIHKRKVMDYWTEYSSWGFKNLNRWDAVANYALWTKSKYSFSTLSRNAHDLSYIDTRGMNQRMPPAAPRSHAFDSRSFNGGDFCLTCEVEGSRFDRNLLKRAKASLRFRINHEN
jgi:hypothetical protein